MHVFITGGAGFIGSHLADLHRAKGDEVTVLDDLSTGRIENIASHLDNPDFHFHEGALESWEGLEEAVEQADRVYHLAAVVGVKHVLENPVEVITVNQDATERLLKIMAAQGSKAPVVVTSSSEVYGFNEKSKFSEEDDLVLPSRDRLRWCYTVTKLADEMLAFAYRHQHELKTITVRLFNTIGRRQRARYGMVVPHFVEEALQGRPVTVYGDGSQSRSFCDVRDTARFLYKLAGCQEAIGQVVNIGSDQEVSMNELANLVIKRAGSHSIIEYTSYEKAYGVEFRDIHHRRPNTSLMERLINDKASYTLSDTIDDLIEHFEMFEKSAG